MLKTTTTEREAILKMRLSLLRKGIDKNQPLNKEQVANLPKGFTPTGIFPNNRERRAKMHGTPWFKMNNRKLTLGRKSFRTTRYRSVLPL